MEDALKRLDKLTHEEARMAAAENLRLMHIVINGTPGVLANLPGESHAERAYIGQTEKKLSRWSNNWQAA